MMSSQSIQSHVEPLFGGKMPLADRTISSKPKTMSDLRSKQTLQYSEACFPCDRREKEVAGFTPPWTNLKASLLDVRNPVSHLSGMGGQNHIIYRQDSSSSDEGHSSSLHHAAVKQGFTLYSNSPGMSSPAAATSVSGRKHKTGDESLSPPSENTVYLAIPKPIYGLNPCCRDLGCVIGHRYGVEHGSARIPSAVYEHEWLQNDARYTERGKAQDALLQQRGLQFEPSAEALKRISVGTYSPGRVRTFPAVIDPNYTYPFTLPHTLFGSLREQSQRLQTSPRGYPSFYPSHPTYEHMTSEVYQEHSPMSKYGRLTQHPMFYYPQANVEVENRTQCKDICSKQREDVPVILKNSISNHREHYMVPQLLHGEIPRPLSEETLHNHSFMRGSDHQAFAPPGFHSNSAQIRELLSSSRIHVSPKKPYIHHPGTSAANLHKDKLSAGLPQTHLPFCHVDRTSPPRRTSQPGISPSSVPVNRFIPPLTSLHLHRPILPPAALNSDKLRDHSSFESQVTCPRQASGIPVPPGLWLSQSPTHSSGRIHAPLPGSANVPKIIYSPAVTPGKKEKHPLPSQSSVVQKGCLKRSFSHSSSPAKIKEEDRELYEVELLKKRQKMKMENVLEKNENDPPLMPVIDNVFSLASYQAYLQAPGLLFPGRVSQRIPQQSEHREVKCRPDIKQKKPCQDEQQPAVCLVSKEARADSQEGSGEMFELKTIKAEKVDSSDTDNSAKACVSPKDYRHVTIKKEPEDVGSSNREPMLVIKKVNPDKLEGKPSLEEQKETSDESSQSKATAQIKTSDQRDASKMQEQVVTIQPTPNTSPQLDNGEKFKNIPPQCLKLSNYKIVFHSTNHSSPVLPPQKLAEQPVTEFVPKSEPQTPVRKHFFEMHQSLCKLVSKSVLASSTQDLKAWLSQLDLSRPASPPTKVKKVSCLFGKKAREAWLNDDIKLALHKLLERLREYMAQERCPFPHVMRTGAVFLPMLVVKELLFPTVQGSFIDQVLQEHKVELRPTTLSEEKILIQLHKRACSSRLRRLMSLKHLPDIYADVVSLMYYTCVCKHLGLDLANPANRDKDETMSCTTQMLSDIMASPASPTELQRHPNDQEVNRKGRVKTSSRRMFLDSSLSDEEEADSTEKTVKGRDFNPAAELESSVSTTSTSSENSWMCPLTLDELSSCPSDAEIDKSSIPDTQYSPPAKSVVRSRRYSGMILKLRRTFSKDLNRKVACYQAISDSGTLVDPTQTDDMNSELELHRQTPKKWQRTGKFCHALRPLSSSKRKRSPLLKIKYCPYLSACHSAEHRRRWVLRSAVQRAQRAMKFHYPDLVGKRIHHLYEEDDKSEVWYRGEVLRIHEAHTNPLKTIFEVRYDSEPEWKYYLELLIDYKKGWLKIEDNSPHVNM